MVHIHILGGNLKKGKTKERRRKDEGEEEEKEEEVHAERLFVPIGCEHVKDIADSERHQHH